LFLLPLKREKVRMRVIIIKLIKLILTLALSQREREIYK